MHVACWCQCECNQLCSLAGYALSASADVAMQGALAVSAYVTHGVFPNDSWKRFTASSSSNGTGATDFKHFWITDSCPKTGRAVANQAPFEVISLAEPIAAALQI